MTATQQIDIEKTFQKERGRLFNFIRQRVKSVPDAEDILQEVFYQFVRVSEEVTGIEQASAWLFKVARNKITDSYRKKKSLTFSDIGTVNDEEEGSLSFQDYLPDVSALPDSQMMREMVWEVLEEGLSELPTEQRDVFVMHEFDGISFKEISSVTGEEVNTLISRKRYAIVHLREKLNELYNEILKS